MFSGPPHVFRRAVKALPASDVQEMMGRAHVSTTRTDVRARVSAMFAPRSVGQADEVASLPRWALARNTVRNGSIRNGA
jgi:hypothetical protein